MGAYVEREIPVVPVGSTGGGDLFVVECESGNVLFLPHCPVYDGRYDGTHARIRVIARDVTEFLQRLLNDVFAFENNKSNHVFISG